MKRIWKVWVIIEALLRVILAYNDVGTTREAHMAKLFKPPALHECCKTYFHQSIYGPFIGNSPELYRLMEGSQRPQEESFEFCVSFRVLL